MTGADRYDRAARRLCMARLERDEVQPLPDELAPADEHDGYLVQDRLHRQLTGAGWGEIAGYKLGCTTPIMREILGLDHPVFGGIFSSTVHHREAVLRHAAFVRPAIESEIAVVLGDNLPARGQPYDEISVAPAIGACMAAIELVDNRCDPEVVGLPTQIADDYFGAGSVLGAPDRQFDPLMLDEVVIRLQVNREQIGEGSGSMQLGHPLKALAWLANALIERGHVLAAGQFVSLGSVVAGYYVAPGDEAIISSDQLGEVRVRYA